MVRSGQKNYLADSLFIEVQANFSHGHLELIQLHGRTLGSGHRRITPAII